jgi:hypothetical protein
MIGKIGHSFATTYGQCIRKSDDNTTWSISAKFFENFGDSSEICNGVVHTGSSSNEPYNYY